MTSLNLVQCWEGDRRQLLHTCHECKNKHLCDRVQKIILYLAVLEYSIFHTKFLYFARNFSTRYSWSVPTARCGKANFPSGLRHLPKSSLCKCRFIAAGGGAHLGLTSPDFVQGSDHGLPRGHNRRCTLHLVHSTPFWPSIGHAPILHQPTNHHTFKIASWSYTY